MALEHFSALSSNMTLTRHGWNPEGIPPRLKTTPSQHRCTRLGPLQRLIGLVAASLAVMDTAEAMACTGRFTE